MENVYLKRTLSQVRKFDDNEFIYKDENGDLIKSPVDQYFAQDFMLNEHGFPINNVSMMMRATSLDELQALFQRYKELPTSDIGDTPPDVVLSQLRPRSLYDVVEVDARISAFNDYLSSKAVVEIKDEIKSSVENVEPAKTD